MSHTPAEPGGSSSPPVEVITARVSQAGPLLETVEGVLSAEERERSRRFVREADRSRFMLGRVLVRKICARHLGVEAAEVRFDATPLGKLLLAYPAGWKGGALDFNVSHSGDVVALAWSLAGPLGVDVECLDRSFSADHGDIANLVFSPEERRVLSYLERSSPDLSAFFRIWVRKEAVIKAEGCGIGGRLLEFTVVSHTGEGVVWADAVRYPGGQVWRLVDLECPAGHVAAMALPVEMGFRYAGVDGI